MIRFTDVVPDAKPKKAAVPTREREPVMPLAAASAADEPQPAKAPRKAKKSA